MKNVHKNDVTAITRNILITHILYINIYTTSTLIYRTKKKEKKNQTNDY